MAKTPDCRSEDRGSIPRTSANEIAHLLNQIDRHAEAGKVWHGVDGYVFHGIPVYRQMKILELVSEALDLCHK